jgi:23S rRNA pseudouridine1911/1915/1917 synthase
VIERGASWAALRCRLDTGRTHQIRVHLHSIGHPLIGDPVYRRAKPDSGLPRAALEFRRQALHAEGLSLVHPGSGHTLSWHAPLPPDLVSLLEALRSG